MNNEKLNKKTDVVFKSILKFLKDYWVCVAIILLVAFIRFFVLGFSQISGPSMVPTLHDGDEVMVNKLNKEPKRGDVIIFNAVGVDPRYPRADLQHGEVDYIKRVIGVPGDTVSKQGSNLYVNGKKVNQDYLDYNTTSFKDEDGKKATTTGKEQRNQGSKLNTFANWDIHRLSTQGNWNSYSNNAVKVPKGTYFVMGDHRSVSNDSRYFGFVKEKNISGVVSVMPWKSAKEKALVNTASDDFFEKGN